MPALCIGIGGMSQAGKSALAGRLATHWSDRAVAVIAMDDYVVSKEELPLWTDGQGIQHPDWEHLSSINIDRFSGAVVKALESNEIVVVEGILLFHFPELNRLFDQRILMEIDKETFLMRRRSDSRWGKPNEAYIEHVWEAYWENKKGLDLEDIAVFRSSNPSDEAFGFLVS